MTQFNYGSHCRREQCRYHLLRENQGSLQSLHSVLVQNLVDTVLGVAEKVCFLSSNIFSNVYSTRLRRQGRSRQFLDLPVSGPRNSCNL